MAGKQLTGRPAATPDSRAADAEQDVLPRRDRRSDHWGGLEGVGGGGGEGG